ncbi:Hint domain-containing protein [Tanticharoenia sakaeratensis]|uniref:Hedgehog/Intein (Hint) domain-containing protein n=1 Tax=Tanticharoenia sakaeratensis NBRC 103193 TaxID=1231623 RepID=A0A0D6MNX8_9PROT|nr:Hint domain-containing protein [Tanticharoenia sakaeratensis]GAN54993.1 hypothetical protein Tasa_036_011 [Tanticharoenia sakaeratensis NBRC 103193]
MSSSLNAFTEGDLVISIVGDGDDSGTYTDNQASPITLEEITTDGQSVGEMVLPQTTTTVDGTTEYAISGEYGSSSEGALELSADGKSLVIGGYGINAATYNAGGAAVYGDARLAQSTSLTGTQYTAVPRVIADVSYDGTVDTSTTVYGVFNTNNIRSVATVDGTSFYIAGQGVKGDDTQGVFEVSDGANTATAIDTSTDAREVEIVNGQLYVSRDSTQGGSDGTSNIGTYGTVLPVSRTTAEVLPNIAGTVTLSAAQENTVNAASVGQTVNLSPEAYFFANATTLYVADSGNPKGGGTGDGGLQKWSYVDGAWHLDYTLSTGLNLVSNSASSGTTGLISLTGKVVGDTVELYATNATVGDLDQTYLYGITDDLNATTAPSDETFTTLVTAAADTNIRGVAFAPGDSSAGSAVTVASGVVSSGLDIASGGSLDVQSGALVQGAVLESGTSGTIEAGGIASGGALAHGATELVLGSASGVAIQGAQVVSAAGASVSDETVTNGGSITLAIKGATASGITLNNGGVLAINGNAAATDTTILSGGTIALESPKATLSGAVTFSGKGTLLVEDISSSGYGDQAVISGFGTGDLIDDTAIGTGATFSTAVSGSDTVVTITSGSVSQSFVFEGETIGSSLALASDGSGGVALSTASATSSSTATVVSSGSILSGAMVSSGQSVTVEAGGTLQAATILSGGTAAVAGLDSGSVISAGGAETLTGSATGDQIYGTQTLATSGASVRSETVLQGGVLSLSIKGTEADNVTVAGGTLSIDGNAVASGTILTQSGVLDLQSPKAAVTGTLTFEGAGTLQQDVAPSTAGTGIGAVVAGFGVGDAIDLVAMTGSATLSQVTSGSDVLVTVTNGTVTESVTFSGSYTEDYFTLQSDGQGGAEIVGDGTPCFCPGTMIRTGQGDRPVESLAIGDRVTTHDGRQRPIRWIGRRSYDGRFIAGRTDILPVLIKAGALGRRLPVRDLVVSPLHAMYLGGVLVPALALVNGQTIVQQRAVEHVDYIHVELDSHDIIFAEGAATETFLDDDSRGMFHNAHEYEALYPDAPRAPALYCAPRVEEGDILEAIRRRLAA